VVEYKWQTSLAEVIFIPQTVGLEIKWQYLHCFGIFAPSAMKTQLQK